MCPDPEQKRKIIGGEFIEVFQEEARKLEELISRGQEPSIRILSRVERNGKDGEIPP